MANAGQIIVAGRIPGERIGIAEATADSGLFTAETVVMSVTVPLVSGRTYSVWANPGLMSTISGDVVRARLREDDIAGTILDGTIEDISNNTSNTTRKHAVILLSDYQAVSTGNKTFVVTGARATGSGNVHLEGVPGRKSYIVVRYESG